MATNGLTGDSSAESSRRPTHREGFAEPNFSSPATAVSLLVTNSSNEIEKFLVHKDETHELNLVQLQPYECPTDEQSLEEDFTLVETWVLADFLCIPRLQNDIVDYMNQIAADLDQPPSSAVYEYIYENTLEHSALRKAIVVLVVAVMDHFCIRKDADDHPKDMLVDIVETMGNMKKPIVSYQNILKQYPQAYVSKDK